MDGDVVNKVSKQQVKGEERGGEEEVVHRMKIDLPHRCEDEHQKEKEEQRDRGEVADFSG